MEFVSESYTGKAPSWQHVEAVSSGLGRAAQNGLLPLWLRRLSILRRGGKSLGTNSV